MVIPRSLFRFLAAPAVLGFALLGGCTGAGEPTRPDAGSAAFNFTDGPSSPGMFIVRIANAGSRVITTDPVRGRWRSIPETTTPFGSSRSSGGGARIAHHQRGTRPVALAHRMYDDFRVGDDAAGLSIDGCLLEALAVNRLGSNLGASAELGGAVARS